MAVRKAEAIWKGNLKEGSGTMKLPSQGYEGPFTYASRFEDGKGTNPEELIGAAIAGCFSMHLSNQLATAGFTPESINTTASVRIESGTINQIVLDTTVTAPGLSEEVFNEKVNFSKANCPVSKALASVGEIIVNATLA
jgi:osmotically inducible protein OsmC